MMNPIAAMAMNMLQKNPKLQKNPQAQALVEIIQNGDEERGKQMAENLCNTYGISKDEVLSEAKKRFGI